MDAVGEGEATSLDVPVLRGRGVALRLATPADLDALVTHLDDFDVVRMLARIKWPLRRAEVRGFLSGVARRARDGEAEEFAVLPDGGPAAGMVGISRVGTDYHVGYWLGRAFWGRGLATEAVRLALRRLFAADPAARVVSGLFWDNAASLRVQQKLGFRVTGEHMHWCAARRRPVRHVDTLLERANFRDEPR